MVRYVLNLDGDVEIRSKKPLRFRGIYSNVFPVLPYGSLRKFIIATEDKDVLLKAENSVLEREVKNIHFGDRVEVVYTDYETFYIKKI